MRKCNITKGVTYDVAPRKHGNAAGLFGLGSECTAHKRQLDGREDEKPVGLKYFWNGARVWKELAGD